MEVRRADPPEFAGVTALIGHSYLLPYLRRYLSFSSLRTTVTHPRTWTCQSLCLATRSQRKPNLLKAFLRAEPVTSTPNAAGVRNADHRRSHD